MDSVQAAQAFNGHFMRVYQRFYRRVRPTAYRPGPQALAVLRHLHGAGPLTITEAACHFSRSQASMSELVARLERRGLLCGVADQRDRRRTLVWLTEAGVLALEESLQVLSVRKLEIALDQLSDSEREGVVSALATLLSTDMPDEGWEDEPHGGE